MAVQVGGDPSFQHLQLAFNRLSILLHRLVARRLMQAEEDGHGKSSPWSVSHEEALGLLQRAFGQAQAPALVDERESEAALAQASAELQEFCAAAERAGSGLRWQQLAERLGLGCFDQDVLLLSLAPDYDSRYGLLYAYLQDDLTRRRPTVELILDVLAPDGPERLMVLGKLAPDTPLFRRGLVALEASASGSRPLFVSQTLVVDEGILGWLLLGRYHPPKILTGILSYETEPAPDAAFLTSDQHDEVGRAAGERDHLILTGPDSLSQLMAARQMAASGGRPLLTLDLEQTEQSGLAAEEGLRLLLRDARLTGALPHIVQWDRCLVDNCPPATLLNELAAHPGAVVIAGEATWRTRSTEPRRHVRRLAFPLPDYEQRQALLRHFLQRTLLPTEEHSGQALRLPGLAGQFELSSEQLRDLVTTAADSSRQEGVSMSARHLFAAARLHSNPRLATMASKLTPRYEWNDLVLPDEQVEMLRELVNTVTHRTQVLQAWHVGDKLASSAGVTVLFVGPPGTGKTMAAEVIAGELELDLYKIDLSGVVSKYIGETEKNLEKIFSEAESSNAILFFDEADAIFGKRSEVKDAHDRYANIEISYLLQRMESYNGVTILASNLGGNLDEAFMRRLQYGITFPFPEQGQRLQIWQGLFPPDLPREADLDLERLARRFNLAGGNIRNVIINAAYLAAGDGQVVTMRHLLHATKREMQKMGRMVREQDFEV